MSEPILRVDHEWVVVDGPLGSIGLLGQVVGGTFEDVAAADGSTRRRLIAQTGDRMTLTHTFELQLHHDAAGNVGMVGVPWCLLGVSTPIEVIPRTLLRVGDLAEADRQMVRACVSQGEMIRSKVRGSRLGLVHG